MHATIVTHQYAVKRESNMSDLFLADGSYPASYHPRPCVAVRRQPAQCQPPPPPHAQALPAQDVAVFVTPPQPQLFTSKAESARQSRNRAEKQRRDKMNESISVLASIVPPVVMAGRKVDKTSVLRLTAHYLRSHKHVFGRSIRRGPRFSSDFTQSILKTMKGFILTTTYKGLVVVVSQNVQEFLGYTELELLGQNLYNFVHPEDHQLLTEQLFPRSCNLTSNGELLLSNEPEAEEKAAEALKNEKRAFLIRFKKLTYPRSTPTQYVTCHVEGSFRKSDGAGVYVDKRVQVGRRLRSRGNNPYASGNDIVFVGMIRPVTDTFTTESRIESFKMEYRTRHSIDGSIIQCEHRISIVTGYMTNEVTGVNAMHFMHRNDVRWVVVALREMYVHHRLMGESCYRLMMKNGKFVYMRTTGALDVNPDSKEATSFICTNTVVSESEGVELIKQMKKKFSYKINNEEPMDANLTGNAEVDQSLPVEDPRQLEQVIYHLVTDLPSPQEENDHERRETSNPELAIIPPKREQIRKAIEKSYSIIRTLRTSEPRSRSYFTSMCDERSPSRSSNDRSENDREEQININRCAWCYKLDQPDTRVSDTHNMVDNNRSSSPRMHTGLLSEHSHGMSFNEACGVTPDDDIECGGSWNPLISTQADLFQLPEDVSSFMECSFFDLDSSVSFEHDFELSQMDVERLLSTLNDENLLETAAQACEALNEADIDDGEQPAPEAMDVQEHPDDPYEFREENEIIYHFSLWRKKDKDKDKM